MDQTIQPIYSPNSTADSSVYNIAGLNMDNHAERSDHYRQFQEAVVRDFSEYKGPESDFIKDFNARMAALSASLGTYRHPPYGVVQIDSFSFSPILPKLASWSQQSPTVANLIGEIASFQSSSPSPPPKKKQPSRRRNLLSKPLVRKNVLRIRTEASQAARQDQSLEQQIDLTGQANLRQENIDEDKEKYEVTNVLVDQNKRNTLKTEEVHAEQEIVHPQKQNLFRIKKVEVEKELMSEILKKRKNELGVERKLKLNFG